MLWDRFPHQSLHGLPESSRGCCALGFYFYRQAQYVLYCGIEIVLFFIIMFFFFHNLMCFENLLLPLQQSIEGMAELRNKLRGRLRCFYSFILLME